MTASERAQAIAALQALQRERALADALKLAVEGLHLAANLLEVADGRSPVAREVDAIRNVAAWCAEQARDA